MYAIKAKVKHLLMSKNKLQKTKFFIFVLKTF